MTAGIDSAILSSKERRALRARAHALRPVVWIAESGISAGALREIDSALRAHELIKIHAAADDRDERAVLLARICAELRAQPVQVIGKMLVAFRARPEPAANPQQPPPASRKKRQAAGTKKRQAAGTKARSPASQTRPPVRTRAKLKGT